MLKKNRTMNGTSDLVRTNITKHYSKPKLIILSDSHGRNLGNLIEQQTSLNVLSFVKPGAKFDQIVEDVKNLSRDLSMNDFLLVIGGTINVETTETIAASVHGLIRNTLHTNLIIASLPVRHDRPDLDPKISEMNSELERIVDDHLKVGLLSLHRLPRHLFTNHGLHFNKQGKARIANLISSMVSNNKNGI